MTARNKEEGLKEVSSTKPPMVGVNCWEGSLWHVRAELLGWKVKMDSLLKIVVDDGLGLILGLGFVYKDLIEVFAKKGEGGMDGSKGSNSNIGNEPDRGPLKKPVF